ncbi:hypothetical protein LguiA_004822 [Lonicera macranthoides]
MAINGDLFGLHMKKLWPSKVGQKLNSAKVRFFAVSRQIQSRLKNFGGDANEKTHVLEGENKEYVAIFEPTTNYSEEDKESQAVSAQEPEKALTKEKASFKSKLTGIFHLILEELTASVTIGSISSLKSSRSLI